MTAPRIAGFSIVRNATLLDFPLEASVASVLPAVDEFVLAVGKSDDDTLARARAIADPRMRIIETEWDLSLGPKVLSTETNRAIAACRADWGIYIQADEVLADGGAERLRELIDRRHADAEIEGVVVDYLHFYGSFDVVGMSRRWYRREIRAIRLDRDIRSDGDAQGFRRGPDRRRAVSVRSNVPMFHYSSARPPAVLQVKRAHDRTIYDTERAKEPDRPLLPWAPGLTRFRGLHPAAVRAWVDARRGAGAQVEPPSFSLDAVRTWASLAVERTTGWRPFEFRNYTLHK